MGAVQSVTQSNQLVAQILQMALAQQFDLQDKLLAYTAQTQAQFATDAVRGQAFDILA